MLNHFFPRRVLHLSALAQLLTPDKAGRRGRQSGAGSFIRRPGPVSRGIDQREEERNQRKILEMGNRKGAGRRPTFIFSIGITAIYQNCHTILNQQFPRGRILTTDDSSEPVGQRINNAISRLVSDPSYRHIDDESRWDMGRIDSWIADWHVRDFVVN